MLTQILAAEGGYAIFESQLMLGLSDGFLPAINASLNGLAGLLLVIGVMLVKQKKLVAHKKCMLAAFGVSALFLVLYLTDKILKGAAHTAFNGTGAIKVVYYVMLISHILLAMSVPVFAIMLIRQGLKDQLEKHRKLAKIAFPIWMYVSITGVLIYLALYPFNPAPAETGGADVAPTEQKDTAG